MADIVVTIPAGFFKRVNYKRKGFLRLKRVPKRLERGDYIYICYEGYVRECYVFKGYDAQSREESIRIGMGDVFFLNLGAWYKLPKPIQMKGFRGFRYW